MKNKILTFLFAFVPGAGQMYQGYMKRGLSLITMLVLIVMAGSFVSTLYYACAIVWMYSFFDTFNLRAQLGAGTAAKDDYILHLDRHDSKMRRLLAESHRLLGWGLIAFAALAVYEQVLMRLLDDIMWRSEGGSVMLNTVYLVCDQLPTVFVCVVLVICGVWLVRGPKGTAKPAANEKPALDEFCEYRAAAAGETPIAGEAPAAEQPAAEPTAEPEEEEAAEEGRNEEI